MSKFNSGKSSKAVRPTGPMIDTLEDRRYMTVGPATIPSGTSNDSVFDTNTGNLHVIYYDNAAKTLKYQQFHNNGTSDPAVTVDSAQFTGQYLSLAEDSTGVLHAAYYDGINGDLKYASRTVGGVWSTQVIDSKTTVGLYPSIALTTGDLPTIAYYNKTSGNLKVAAFNGSTWALSTVASTDDVGRYPSLAFSPTTHRYSIAYENSTLGHFLYGEDTGAGFAVTNVDSNTTAGGGYISLSFNPVSNQPAMSYYDAFNSDLKYAERSSRGKWTPYVVAPKSSQGLYTDLAWTFDTNQPAIAYWAKSNDSVILSYRKPDQTFVFQTQVTNGGRNLSVTDGLSINGQKPDLFLVYTDSISGDLKVGTF